ncbi:MAG TPA: 2-hydroxyacyl-CoA dehydratase family protein [Spirochaetota bacterium]|nr:2-hydroxyacyl-CoA dehydratase family protein [Spirochaetota bacterium]HPC39607.1 2-hydroxyacyl-CoA dehydratase family protein [Spirochaetota bacterium]HPL19314.1 2-hydroxyacyl-CoA dehydratase family protein [Spirochaetota bacterium]HQF09503.1 2-hydroxyacyl-CoA dehydratase family protein [Spirochaetota bacterium]HQH98186.1 2-hydroxyacyl-CoA dehydratase family protein [Spirochaetota bacterium]
MNQYAGISLFDDLLAEPLNRLAEQAMGEGRVPVGYTCSYVPETLLSAGKLFPVRLRAPGIAGTEMADTYMSNVICSYTKSLLEFAIGGAYDRLGGVVFTANCDHMRRLMDNLEYLRKPAFSHTLDVPHKRGGPALDWFTEELKMLADKMSAHFGVSAAGDDLAAAIRSRNAFAEALRAIGDLRKLDPPLITGGEFHRVMIASLVSPKDLLMPLVEDFRRRAVERGGVGPYRARIMVAGGELDDLSFIDVIESQGGLVVADRFCTGSLPGLEPVPESGDPLRAIAQHTLYKVLCPRMMEEFDEREEAIRQTALEYRADGVIIQAIKFCDTWGVEGSTLTAALRSAGIPVLRLEREYRHGGEGQLRTRVQAFIESMGK